MAIEVKNDVYLTITEASKEIGRAKQTVYQNWRAWGWTSYVYGGTLLFKKSNLQEWLQTQVKETSQKN